MRRLAPRPAAQVFERRSAVWSHELAMMAPELVERLNEALAEDGREVPVSELRFRVGTDL